jgi:hypothetical protein
VITAIDLTDEPRAINVLVCEGPGVWIPCGADQARGGTEWRCGSCGLGIVAESVVGQLFHREECPLCHRVVKVEVSAK